jgi:prepilin-type N-terminal cleavage/methylation domain-containing protein
MNKKGFTLIELLIVVAIIGILAAIAVPNFMNAQVRAKIARCQSDMKSLSTAIEQMRLDIGFFPVDHWDDDTDLGCERLTVDLGGVGAGPDCEQRNTFAVLACLTSPVAYMSSLPHDPFYEQIGSEGNCYRYGDYETSYIGKGGGQYNHNFNALKPGNAEANDMRPLGKNEYVMVGAGPDKEFGLGAGASDPNRAMPYNASNGTTSSGDILFRSGGGAPH